MSKRSQVFLVVGVLLALVIAGTSWAAASAAAPVLCPIGSTCVTWQDQDSARVQQDLLLEDRNGSPVWWCNNAGGCWVGDDKLGVTGASVYDNAAYLAVSSNGVNGKLVIDGVTLDARDIAFLVCLNKGGTLAACKNGG